MPRRLSLRVLFVCTGNTCRSPMAETIAAAMTARKPAKIDLHFASAGVGASSGSPMTPEAADALREMGFPAGRHASRRLTARDVHESDVIFTMTRGHLASVLAVVPSAASKSSLLDPGGDDVPDPIGSSREVYTDTARLLADLIAKRLEEFRS